MEMDKTSFTEIEKRAVADELASLLPTLSPLLQPEDISKIDQLIQTALESGIIKHNVFGLNPLIFGLQTARIAIDEIGLKREGLLAILVYACQFCEDHSIEEINTLFGEGVSHIIHGLQRIQQLYVKSPAVESENFRNLLISLLPLRPPCPQTRPLQVEERVGRPEPEIP